MPLSPHAPKCAPAVPLEARPPPKGSNQTKAFQEERTKTVPGEWPWARALRGAGDPHYPDCVLTEETCVKTHPTALQTHTPL